MIPEPVDSGGQAIQRRNNNLLCYAAVLFVIGLGFIQVAAVLVPFWIAFYGVDPTGLMVFLITAIFVGVLPTLGGVYLLWRWWKSGT